MALRSAYLSMHRQINTHVTKFGITADQFICLFILAEEDGLTQQEIVQRAASDPNTIRSMLLLLEDQKLVSRDAHPTDGRARYVTITDKGRNLYKQLLNAVEPVHTILYRTFSKKDAEILLNYLNRIYESMTG